MQQQDQASDIHRFEASECQLRLVLVMNGNLTKREASKDTLLPFAQTCGNSPGDTCKQSMSG